MPRVLIVEDDPGTQQMLELFFVAEGFEVETASDGPSALARLRLPPVDLVILDVMIPQIDGISVLRALRASTDQGWQRVPVVVSTARGEDNDVWDGWKAGADYYLVKPFDLEQLRAVARRLVGAAS